MIENRLKILLRLFDAVWGCDRTMQYRMVLGFLLIILTSLANLAIPWCLKFIIDYLSNPQLLKTLVLLLTSYGIIWITSQALINLRQITVIRVFERGIRRFGYTVFNKLLTLPVSYHVRNPTGSIMNAIERTQMAIPMVLFGLLFFVISGGNSIVVL